MRRHLSHNRQGGAALVVGLMLLVVITVLAISGMNTATTELAMARNDQNYENAFQAAETGLARALSAGSYQTAAAASFNGYAGATASESYTVDIVYENDTIVPDKAFSLGSGSGVRAYHFLATSTAVSARDPGVETDRDASAVHTQAFYVVGPQAPTIQ
ncbi:MAG: pilus assembly PilX N-terminal domain-containing protein [Pseudomonadota bacterium]